MKLRIRGNSIRLRLTQTELEQFGESGRVKDGADFGGGSHLGYALVRDERSEEVKASFGGSGLTVSLPAKTVEEWVNTDLVSIRADQAIDSESVLKILVEKDFQCLAPREDEDESDMFPHPNA